MPFSTFYITIKNLISLFTHQEKLLIFCHFFFRLNLYKFHFFSFDLSCTGHSFWFESVCHLVIFMQASVFICLIEQLNNEKYIFELFLIRYISPPIGIYNQTNFTFLQNRTVKALVKFFNYQSKNFIQSV